MAPISLRTVTSNLWRLQCVLWISLACVLQSGQAARAATVVINEVVASNNTVLEDAQHEYDDWIELYNTGTAPVDVAGMYITDDLQDPTKWQFPSGRPELTTIAPGGFLLLWADGDTADPGLHASFNLSVDGEEIGLFDSDGVTLLDSVTFGPQRIDMSYGRYPDGSANWTFMAWATPEDNNVNTYAGAVVEPQFSQVRGFYDSAFSLELTTPTEGATIYYRLDYIDPLVQGGRGQAGTKYTGPIPISRTTCVRAVATKPGWLSSTSVTATYIFPDNVIRQSASPAGFPAGWGGRTVDYAMDQRVVNDPAYSGEIKDDLKSTPSVCIVIANEDLFGSTGIYSHPAAKGDQWERAASVEWIDPRTGDHFGVNAGLRIQGGDYSRTRASNPKSGLQIFFRAEYGLSQLEYPLFPDTEVKTFKRIGLREIWNYSWIGDSGMSGNVNADYLRDCFARDTTRDMGGLAPYGRPVQVYLNGLYWGLYIMTERIDDDFVADHLGGDKEDYDVLEAPSNQGGSTMMKVLTGDRTTTPPEWNALFAKAGESLSSPEAYQAIQQYVDVAAMIDYMLMIYYTGSRDAPVFLGDQRTPRNFDAVRRREPAGPFVFVPWDVEWALENPSENRVRIVGVWNPHYLMDRLATNADFCMLLADHVYRHFYNGGALTPESATQRYMARANEIRGAIGGESARWGDVLRSQPYTRTDWEAEVNRLVKQYFSGRTQTVLNQLKARGWYPSVSPPDFYVKGAAQRGGHISNGDTITLSGAGGTIWYTLDGSDPRVPGATASNDQSLTWVPENAAKKVLVPTRVVDDAWRGGTDFDDSTWISGSGGVGLERSSGYETLFSIDLRSQMYGKNATCYIRIPFTLSPADYEDVSKLLLNVRYDDGFIAYLNGVEVQRAGFDGVPAWNSAALSNHDDAEAVNPEAFDISAHIDLLRNGQNILAIQGLNAGASSSDFLISVELKGSKGTTSNVPTGVSPTAIRYHDPILLDASAHIKVRTLSGSTWSALNEAVFAVGPVAESLRISEIMYHPAETGTANDPNTEFIELTNVGTQTINLSLVQFTNGVDFIFPSYTLAPGNYCLVVEDTAAFEAGYSSGLPVVGQYQGSLSNAGERIELQDAAGDVIHNFRFEDNWFSTTDGGGFSLTIKDPRTTDPNNLGDKSAWRPSTRAGGSPGAGN